MTNSLQAFEHVQRRIPGGTSSPVRVFRAVGGEDVERAARGYAALFS